MDHVIPEISLSEILEGHPILTPSPITYIDGAMPDQDASALISILAKENPVEVLEIGTFMGHTTRRMAETLPNVIIHTVDLPVGISKENDPNWDLKSDPNLIETRDLSRNFKGTKYAFRIRQHIGDTLTWDFREAGRPTFFLIDGSHTYEYCENDSRKCFDLCNGKGVFLWHDCDERFPGVLKFVSEWRGLGRDIKVISGTYLAYWNTV